LGNTNTSSFSDTTDLCEYLVGFYRPGNTGICRNGAQSSALLDKRFYTGFLILATAAIMILN